jgi:hypothetical protein
MKFGTPSDRSSCAQLARTLRAGSMSGSNHVIQQTISNRLAMLTRAHRLALVTMRQIKESSASAAREIVRGAV